ncbi:hypothetical protein [Actinacidiphila sp. bgisy167]|uniref:hypothetical protein n=1 Tax=Actinacidiphila sp. bgisy167 TaxID=3413797 RepID=UPI003D71E8B2
MPAALCVVALGTLTGCTVPAAAGVTGIAVSEDGTPSRVMPVCHDRIDGATLYAPDDGDATEPLAQFRADACRGV